MLAVFRPDGEATLHVDASRLKGLGFALLQEQRGVQRLITCGSRFLSPTERRYAMVELELLAAVWAANKTRIYMFGRPTKLATDHAPLVDIINEKCLDQISNPRLLRLKEKLLPFLFVVSKAAV